MGSKNNTLLYATCCTFHRIYTECAPCALSARFRTRFSPQNRISLHWALTHRNPQKETWTLGQREHRRHYGWFPPPMSLPKLGHCQMNMFTLLTLGGNWNWKVCSRGTSLMMMLTIGNGPCRRPNMPRDARWDFPTYSNRVGKLCTNVFHFTSSIFRGISLAVI